MQQSQIVHQKNDSVGFLRRQRQRISFAPDTLPAFEKNALIGDGCCWHAQHGLCHRIKNRITRAYVVPTDAWDNMSALSAPEPRTVELQLHSQSVAPSRRPESQR